MEKYGLLPDFTGPGMLPPERMAHFRDNIRPNMQYCGLFLAKLNKWCDYIRQYDAKMRTLNKSGNFSSQTGNNSGVGTDPRSIIAGINDAGCYDTYYCDVDSLAGAQHSVMVALLIVALIGLASNIYCLAKMSIGHNWRFFFRANQFGPHLALLIICDCGQLLFALFLQVLPPVVAGHRHKDQLVVYQRYTFRLVPVLLPLLDLCCLLVSWLLIAMLVQRSNTTRHWLLLEADGAEFRHKTIPHSTLVLSPSPSTPPSRRAVIRQLVGIICALTLICVPKFAEYTHNYDIHSHQGIVVPLLRVIKPYRMVALKFLYPSVECVVPILLMLAYIAVIKYHETILLRVRPISTTTDSSVGPTTTVATATVIAVASTNDANASNLAPFSVAGVSRRTQLVIWSSTVLLLQLTMRLSAMIVGVERTLEGSPEEQWPRLRQIIRLTAQVVAVVVVSCKPLIYVHCCPRLLRKDLSTGFDAFAAHSKHNHGNSNNNNRKQSMQIDKEEVEDEVNEIASFTKNPA